MEVWVYMQVLCEFCQAVNAMFDPKFLQCFLENCGTLAKALLDISEIDHQNIYFSVELWPLVQVLGMPDDWST